MRIKALFALALLAPLGWAMTFGIRVEPDENNIAAGRLAGVWEPDAALCERLGVKVRTTRIEFVLDDSFLDSIPAEVSKYLDGMRMYEAGRMTWHEKSGPSTSPYLLTTFAGNPHLVSFRERDGVPLGDIESCNLMIIPAKEHAQDVLFMGGDSANEPFRPFRRVITEPK